MKKLKETEKKLKDITEMELRYEMESNTIK